MDMGEFALHLVKVASAQAVSDQHALERAGQIVEKRAKAILGSYQEDIQPFTDWPELADSTKADRVRQGFRENEPLLRTGEMRDSIGHIVVHNEVAIGSDSDVAVYQELGTSRIPPRSFLGAAVVQTTPEIVAEIGQQVVTSLIGKDVFGGGFQIR